jgi:Xaa-Pro aminopeptidase
MSRFEDRAQRLGALLAERGHDALLVTDLVNVRYLTGFTGTSGIALVSPQARIFMTDFRYVERAAEEVPDYDRRRGQADMLASAADVIGELGAGLEIGFDDVHLSVRAHRKLSEHLGDRAALEPAGGLVEELRAVKDVDEIEAIARATSLADRTYEWLISEHGLAGHTERAVALAMERHVQDLGADGVSFPPIVAAGPNGALPHAEPGRGEIPRDVLVVVDFGAVLDGYCSDCTRTFATGDVSADALETYELVRSAQAEALEAIVPGADVREVDAVARKRIEAAGKGDLFGHGLGHGVGLEVHEGPRLSPSGEGELASGNVVTVEPGVYVPGSHGVRIEDLVVVGEDGPRILTSVGKQLTVVSL